MAAAAFVVAARSHREIPVPADSSASAHVRIERDGLVYEFDAISNRERLTEVGRPDLDLLRDRPADALRLRRAIETDIGRPLESLVDANRETIEALKRMGYL
ncbi:MAG: hypothetical protein K8T90_04140 [Planctomycetes bacterium]|nr:hypothetical protein [Planctomycetota bacterium]